MSTNMRSFLVLFLSLLATVAVADMFPSCALSEGSPPYCPMPAPNWNYTWQLNRSTICNPGGQNQGPGVNATEAAKWGLVCLDWSVGQDIWNKDKNPNTTTGASTLVDICRQIKEVNPTTKCLVYRNTELALQWFENQRAIMYDPAYASFFMQYQPGNPKHVTPGTIYNEDGGCTGCNQFFWNFSNPGTIDWVLKNSEEGPLGVDSPYVDGTYMDDVHGIPEEHADAPANMGLTSDQVLDLQNSTNVYSQRAIETLAARGKFIWQSFGFNDYMSGSPTPSDCQRLMEMVCKPSWQQVPWGMTYNGNTSLAAFLIGRGPFAYIGYSWAGNPLPPYDPLFDALDVGVPVSLCTQPEPGYFLRKWTNGYAALNCSSFTPTLAF